MSPYRTLAFVSFSITLSYWSSGLSQLLQKGSNWQADTLFFSLFSVSPGKMHCRFCFTFAFVIYLNLNSTQVKNELELSVTVGMS